MLKKTMLFTASLLAVAHAAFAQFNSPEGPETIEIVTSFRYSNSTNHVLVTEDSFTSYSTTDIKNFLFARNFDHILTFKCEQALFVNKSRLDVTVDLSSTARTFNANSNNKVTVSYQFDDKTACGRNAARLAKVSYEQPIFMRIDFKTRKILDFGFSVLN